MHRKISLAPMKKLQGTSCTGQSCAMKVCPAHDDMMKVLGCNLWFLWFLSGD